MQLLLSKEKRTVSVSAWNPAKLYRSITQNPESHKKVSWSFCKFPLYYPSGLWYTVECIDKIFRPVPRPGRNSLWTSANSPPPRPTASLRAGTPSSRPCGPGRPLIKSTSRRAKRTRPWAISPPRPAPPGPWWWRRTSGSWTPWAAPTPTRGSLPSAPSGSTPAWRTFSRRRRTRGRPPCWWSATSCRTPITWGPSSARRSAPGPTASSSPSAAAPGWRRWCPRPPPGLWPTCPWPGCPTFRPCWTI